MDSGLGGRGWRLKMIWSFRLPFRGWGAFPQNRLKRRKLRTRLHQSPRLANEGLGFRVEGLGWELGGFRVTFRANQHLAWPRLLYEAGVEVDSQRMWSNPVSTPVGTK